ncbi:hypothetical protein OROGR_020875 [Orobanche gracilis]
MEKMKQIATVDNMCSPLTSTSIAVSEDGNTLLSAGRDQVVLLDLSSYSKKTIKTNEEVKAFCVIGAGSPFALSLKSCGNIAEEHASSQALYFITVGERDVVRIWSSESAEFLFYLLECKSELLELTLTKRLVGYSKGVSDMKFIGIDEKFIAVAANLEQ